MRKPREIRDGLRSCLWTYLLKKDILTHGLHLLHPWSTCGAGNCVLIKVEATLGKGLQRATAHSRGNKDGFSEQTELTLVLPALFSSPEVLWVGLWEFWCHLWEKKKSASAHVKNSKRILTLCSACPTPMSSSPNINKNSFSSSARPMELCLGPHVIHGISAAFVFCSVICTEAAWGASKCAGAHFWSFPNCLIKTME